MNEFIGQYQPPTVYKRGAVVGRERPDDTLVSLADLSGIFDQSDLLIEEDRINASSCDGSFKGVFGRDSVITAALKVASYELRPNGQLDKVIPPITALHRFIATNDFPPAGIHKGDLVHETRTLAEGYPADWFAIGEGVGYNYDGLDGPDRLINLDYRLIKHRPELYPHYVGYIELMLERGIRNSIEYEGAGYVRAADEPERLFPGITDKRWRDGYATTVSDDLSFPAHPIRPVEEQALRWSALLHGADIVEGRSPQLASQARKTAQYVQQQFLKNFVYQDDAKGIFIADAVDASGNKLHAITTDQILVLLHGYHGQTILDDQDLQHAVIQRSFEELFSRGGFKTVSENGPVHPKNKYQGPKSRWPHVCAMAVQAIDAEIQRTQDPRIRAKLHHQALQLGVAMLDPLVYFGSPVEGVHVTDEGKYTLEYDRTPEGKSLKYAKVQAWAGAGGEFVTHYLKNHGITHISVTKNNYRHRTTLSHSPPKNFYLK